MTERKAVDVTGRRRQLLRVALDHWSNALKRVSSRVQGMGYPQPAVVMRRDRDRIEGDDQNQGLLERLQPQGNLLEEEDEVPDGDGTVAMDHDEIRLSYYALRKQRERILDLKRDNEKEEYDAEEHEQDLAMIGEPAGDDGQSTGWLNELDLGWEEAPADPRQIEMTAGTGGGSPEATEPTSSSSTDDQVAEGNASGSASKASSSEDDDTSEGSGSASDDDKVAGAVNGRRADVMDFVEERLREEPDVANDTLKETVQEEFPGAGIEKLSARQFHARYPLQVKRMLAQEG